MKLEILYRPIGEWTLRNDVAIHVLEPSFDKLMQHIDDALKDSFPRIVVYVRNYGFQSGRFNIKASQSTWNKLRRTFEDVADVRCGEVGYKHGHSDGDGFEIYFNEEL